MDMMKPKVGAIETPKVKDPAPMPDPESPAVREAAARERARVMSRGGRGSTILTAPEDRAPAYSSTKTGAA